jgi:tripartite-type tricarboxylate transporter receptor subunit TctC
MSRDAADDRATRRDRAVRVRRTTRQPRRKLVAKLVMAAIATMFCALVSAAPSSAQEIDYPNQTVRLISAFAAGGGNDFMARELAHKFGDQWKKTVIVEPRTGGNGDIATNYVAHATPDGYTLLVTTNATVVINPQLFKSVVRFDPVTDFAPVSLLARQPFLLVVNPNLPVKSLGDLIAYARAHPGKLNFGSSGAGGGAHLAGEMIKTFLNLNMTHVPYKGVAPALQDVVAGHLDFMFAAILTARPFAESGQLRALAVTSKTRNASMPDIPAVAEYPGLENFESDLWYGLLAPAGTNAAIVRKLQQSTVRAFADPKVKALFEPSGTILVGSTPEEFAQVIKDDLAKWAVVFKSAGMTPEN